MKRPHSGSIPHARKRTKIQSGLPKPATFEEDINVDHLPWQEVDVPERLEDAEGFFGLEEIDGVDVRRNDDDDEVEYVRGRVSRLTTKNACQRIPQYQSQGLFLLNMALLMMSLRRPKMMTKVEQSGLGSLTTLPSLTPQVKER